MNTKHTLFTKSFSRFGKPSITSLLNIFVIFAVLIILTTVEVKAAAFTVTNTNDSGTGSLRQAILNANATVADDVINFAIPASDPNCTSGVCIITLTSGELFVDNASEADSLTISSISPFLFLGARVGARTSCPPMSEARVVCLNLRSCFKTQKTGEFDYQMVSFGKLFL